MKQKTDQGKWMKFDGTVNYTKKVKNDLDGLFRQLVLHRHTLLTEKEITTHGVHTLLGLGSYNCLHSIVSRAAHKI